MISLNIWKIGALLVLGMSGSTTDRIAWAGDWPMFRGRNRDGISDEQGWTWQWTGTPRALWKASVGEGFSAVSVKDGRAFTMGHAAGRDTIWCFEAATGRELWKHSYPAERLGQVKPDYPGPRATPTAEGDVLYTVSRDGQVFCLEAATGRVRWTVSIPGDLGLPTPSWGFSSSPLVVGQMLLFNAGLWGLAMDRLTGKLVWASEKGEGSYDTPVVFEQAGQQRLAMFNTDHLVCADAATGKLLWQYPWKSPYKTHAADKIWIDGKLFVSSAYNYGCALLDVTGQTPRVLWQNREMRNHFGTCVLFKGHLYGIDGNVEGGAGLKCIELETGRPRWRSDSTGFGNLMLAGGKLLVLTERGELLVADASPERYTELARAQVLDGRCWTMPVLANGLIYCRNSDGEMVCLDVRSR